MKPLSQLLRAPSPFHRNGDKLESELKDLQHEMLRVQQGLWHLKGRAIIVLEGFDAAGKGGCIRRLTENLDPRGFQVHPIGAPTEREQSRHYLYRFWKALPIPGSIAIFDRSWYGRVLVERVEKLTPRWKEAYREINEFERMLVDDGVTIIKMFLGVSRDEQLRRFEERVSNPYKRWKFTQDDLSARRSWKAYVSAADDLLVKIHIDRAPWQLIRSDNKDRARVEVLKTVTQALKPCSDWMRHEARHFKKESRTLLKKLRKN